MPGRTELMVVRACGPPRTKLRTLAYKDFKIRAGWRLWDRQPRHRAAREPQRQHGYGDEGGSKPKAPEAAEPPKELKDLPK